MQWITWKWKYHTSKLLRCCFSRSCCISFRFFWKRSWWLSMPVLLLSCIALSQPNIVEFCFWWKESFLYIDEDEVSSVVLDTNKQIFTLSYFYASTVHFKICFLPKIYTINKWWKAQQMLLVPSESVQHFPF